MVLRVPRNTDYQLAAFLLGKNPLDLELKYRQAAKEVIDTGSTKLTGFEDFVCRRKKRVMADLDIPQRKCEEEGNAKTREGTESRHRR